MRTGRSYFSAQGSVSGLTPIVPSSSACQVSGAVPPIGVVAPIPVTTTSWSELIGGASLFARSLIAHLSSLCSSASAHGVVRDARAHVAARDPSLSALVRRDVGHGIADGLQIRQLV